MWYLFVFDISFAENWQKQILQYIIQIFSYIQITPYPTLQNLDCMFFCPAKTQGIIIVEGNSECKDAKRQTYRSFKDGARWGFLMCSVLCYNTTHWGKISLRALLAFN